MKSQLLPDHCVRFDTVWARNSSQVDGGIAIARDLITYYGAAQRHYHSFKHIEFCLDLFGQVRDLCINADAVELAIWFHDAIYNIPPIENEQLSANYFMQVSEGLLQDNLRQTILQHILATDHKSLPSDPDSKILVDIDLSSFGRPWDQFISDGQSVRNELSYVADDVFYPQQITFMKQLLDRDRFYCTSWFHDRFEVAARDNLAQYLKFLNQKGYAV